MRDGGETGEALYTLTRSVEFSAIQLRCGGYVASHVPARESE